MPPQLVTRDELHLVGRVAAKTWADELSGRIVGHVIKATSGNTGLIRLAAQQPSPPHIMTWGEAVKPPPGWLGELLYKGEDMNKRNFYIVYVVQNGPLGKTAAETVAVIAESSEQAKMIAVHSGFDPLTHIFFVQQLGSMPDYYEDEE